MVNEITGDIAPGDEAWHTPLRQQTLHSMTDTYTSLTMTTFPISVCQRGEHIMLLNKPNIFDLPKLVYLYTRALVKLTLA